MRNRLIAGLAAVVLGLGSIGNGSCNSDQEEKPTKTEKVDSFDYYIVDPPIGCNDPQLGLTVDNGEYIPFIKCKSNYNDQMACSAGEERGDYKHYICFTLVLD